MQHGALQLSSLIARKDVHDLELLISSRYIANPEDARDPLSLALQLTKPESLSRIVKRQHKDHLRILQSGELGGSDASTIEHLSSVGLLGFNEGTHSFEVLPEVRALVAKHPFTTNPTPFESPGRAEDSSWHVTAATSVRQASEIVRRVQSRPLKLSTKEKVTVATVRELAAEFNFTQPTVTNLLGALIDLGILAIDRTSATSKRLIASEHATDWLLLEVTGRWFVMLNSVLNQLSEQHRQETIMRAGRFGLVLAHLTDDYPLLPETEFKALHDVVDRLNEIGAAVNGDLTPAAFALLQHRVDQAQQITNETFITPAAGVYLQPDLSVIVPGLLNPLDELMLSTMTEPEHVGVSSTLRMSRSTLERAASAQSIQQITEFLERISLTGIPQPLQFTLDDLAAKHHHQIQRAPSGVPVIRLSAQDFLNQTNSTSRNQITSQVTEIARRVAAAASDNEGDLGRRLELAIRHKNPVIVTAVSGGDEREFTLIPVSLKDGRLRATDQRAGVERTLPLSAIVSVVTS